MSILINNNKENIIKYNEDACILREIFNILETKNEYKEIVNKALPILKKYKIKNIKLENIKNIEVQPKNRYKSKLQKIFFKKKI